MTEYDPLTEKEKTISQLGRFNISSFTHTFESFEVGKGERLEKAVAILKAVAVGNSKKQFILLNGVTGCGKTHLIEAVIITWAKRELLARYMTFSEIARSLKTALRQGGDFYDQLFSRYRDATRLVVDDFGMGTTESRFEVSDLEDIIDLRYRKRYYPGCELVTILSTNKDIKELPDRIVSRFYDPEFGEVLYMGDRDYRTRKVV